MRAFPVQLLLSFQYFRRGGRVIVFCGNEGLSFFPSGRTGSVIWFLSEMDYDSKPLTQKEAENFLGEVFDLIPKTESQFQELLRETTII